MWDIIGCGIGVIACAVSVFIALRQHKQLRQLTAIGTDTQNTAIKINADSHKRDVVRKFFCLKNETSKLKCIFPCRYTNKPLPSIEAGDFYALSVLQDLLGHDRLELNFQSVNDDVGADGHDDDAIFLCTPNSNPALAKLALPVELPLGKASTFEGVELPCWFANEVIDGRVIKKIWVGEEEKPLESPSEDAYLECAKVGNPCVSSRDIQKDYAILLRLSTHRKIFVIAGIHQYGTWIAGECLRRLAIEKDTSIRSNVKALLLGENDFLAILWGKFRLSKLTVPELGILDNCVWVRANEGWERRYDLG